jgi:hypothetical protein
MYGSSVDGRPSFFVLNVPAATLFTATDILMHNYYSGNQVEDEDNNDYSNKDMRVYVVPRGDALAGLTALQVSDQFVDWDENVKSMNYL